MELYLASTTLTHRAACYMAEATNFIALNNKLKSPP